MIDMGIDEKSISLLKAFIPFATPDNRVLIETFLTFIDVFNAPPGKAVNPNAVEKLFNLINARDNSEVSALFEESYSKQPSAEDIVNFIETIMNNFLKPKYKPDGSPETDKVPETDKKVE